MALAELQQMGNQSSPYGGVATGHAPQQPNMGLGPNRYIPPTFNYGRAGTGERPNYTQMDWNQMQAHYLPNMTNQGGTASTYMQQLQQMLGGFGQRYGSPNRQPQMPNFGSYNPGFGGPTSYYDQMRGGGMGGGGGLPPGYSYDVPRDRGYTRDMPTNGGRWAYGPNGERIEVGGSSSGSGADYFRNLFGDGGGGMQNPEGYSDRRSLAPSEMRGGNGGFMETIGGGGMGGFGDQMPGDGGFMDIFDTPMRGPRMPYGGNGGGFGGRGGYPMMPQFNPYVLMRNNLQGMNFNEMFDPRFAALFGGNRFGSRTPNSQMQQPIKPQTQLIDGQYASGGKPGGM